MAVDGRYSVRHEIPSIETYQQLRKQSGLSEKANPKVQIRRGAVIRVIRIDSLDIEAGKEKLTMKIVGRAYYQPAQEVKLDKKVVKP